MNGSGLRIGQVAEHAGVNVQTLRYYERRGLLAEPARLPGGRRAYPADAVALVRTIKAAQRLGFTLAEIRQLLGAAGHRPGTVGLRASAAAKIGELDERIGQLQAARAALVGVLDAGCDSLTDCSCGACPPAAAG